MRYTTLIALGTEIPLLLQLLFSSEYDLKKKVEKKHEVNFHIISDVILQKSNE
jgi:hypothetical protein